MGILPNMGSGTGQFRFRAHGKSCYGEAVSSEIYPMILGGSILIRPGGWQWGEWACLCVKKSTETVSL